MSHIKIEKIETSQRYSITHGDNVKSTPSIFMAIHIALEFMLKTGDYIEFDAPYTDDVTFTVDPVDGNLYDLCASTNAGVIYSEKTFDDVVKLIYEHSQQSRFFVFHYVDEDLDGEPEDQ